MNPAEAQVLTAILRPGNPWLVGHNYGRVAPLFFLNSLLRDHSDLGAAGRIDRVLKLLRDVVPRDVTDLPVTIEQEDGLSIAIRGALAADRRAFRTSSGSALFPVSSRLIVATASDDGLGRLTRELIVSSPHSTAFSERLALLFADAGVGASQVEDPVSRFGHLLAGPAVRTAESSSTSESLPSNQSDYDNRLAAFVSSAFRFGPRTQRLSALRALAHAGYMASILRILQGPTVEQSGSPKMVVVYAGLPPGNVREPATVAAIASFRSLIRSGWEATLELAEDRIVGSSSAIIGRSGDSNSRLRQGIIATITSSLSQKINIGDLLPASQSDKPTTLRQFISDGLGGGPEVLAQRVRGLATKIGFAAPDKGVGGVRIALDTPLLTVLVDGLVPETSMGFEQFVTRLRTELGLVLGVGDDDSFVNELESETFGASGRSIYDALMENERELRQRLVRSGLARTYSDAHTEVMSSDA